MAGGSMAPYSFDYERGDVVGPLVVSEGHVELTIEVVDRFTPRLASMLRMIEGMNAVRASFAGLSAVVSDFSFGNWPWPTPLCAPDPGADLLYPAVTPQPWVLHDREQTKLEAAIEQWKRDNPPPPPPPMRLWWPTTFEADEAASRDTMDCSGSGGRWSDLMARIDELVEEP